MPLTISHQLSATTPDDPAYEIRPSHWNSNHAVSLNLAGTEIFGAFSNENNVSFSTNGAGFVVASANVTAAPSPVNVTGANGSSVNAQTIAFSNANGITLGVSTAANGATVTGSHNALTTQSAQAFSASGGSSAFQTLNFVNGNGATFTNNGGSVGISYSVPVVPSSYVSNVNGSSGALSLAMGSSLSSSTNGSSITFGLASNITTALQSAGAYLTTARASNDAVGLNTAQSNVTWTVNSSGLSLDARGYAGTATGFTGANISGSMTHNSAGLSLSLSVAPGGGGADGYNILAAGTQTAATTGSVLFQNSNGLTFGMSNSSVITASYTVPTVTNSSWTVSDAATSATVGRLAFTNANGLTLSLSTSNNGNHTVIGSYTVPTVPVMSMGVSTGGNTLGNTGTQSGQFILAGGNNVTLSVATAAGGNQTVTISAGAGGGVNPVASASNGSFSFTTLNFSNANNVTFGTSAGSIITASVAAPGAAAEANAINLLGANTAGNTTATGSTIGWSGLNLTLSGTNNSQIVVSAPATSSLVGTNGIGISTNGSTVSVYNIPVSVYEPIPVISSTAFSSHAANSFIFNRMVLPDPVAVSNINFAVSFNAAAPAATSVASTGTLRYSYSKGVTIFTRQNYGTGSTNLTSYATASFGLTAGLSYSSTSQSLVVSYVTDTTGGTTSFNTTSNSNGWVSFLSGAKIIKLPYVATLTDGEYFVAHGYSTTTGTTQSNATLMSVSHLHQNWPVANFGILGSTQTFASMGFFGNHGEGYASALTTNNTMAMSVVSQNSRHIMVSNFINA